MDSQRTHEGPEAALPFAGTERFELIRPLGRGGMGAVYEVRDRVRNQRVALKQLSHLEPLRLHLFKQEFRNLADLVHPGLVRLYELFSEDDQWFFTMELVEGLPFSQFVRGIKEAEPETDGTADTVAATSVSAPEEGTADTWFAPSEARCEPPDETVLERLKQAMAGLARAVEALHREGKLHCDLKPSNVLVTQAGEVKLLDFGLVSHYSRTAGPERGVVTGTVPYMSPEQAAGEPLTPASDWYSVGVMLFEILAGRLPHTGTPTEILLAKLKRAPELPPEVRCRVPSPLAALCQSLLHRSPADRASAACVLAAVDRGEESPATARRSEEAQANTRLIGRVTQLECLDSAFAAACEGIMTTVHLRGPSGMGKSALLEHFLGGLRERGAVILRGRCIERETVPFKAVDSLVDELVEYLLRLPELEVAALLPRHVASLARIFPVLRRIEAVADAARRTSPPAASRELRRQAFAALRGLIGSLADRTPLVLAIDDLQWGDLDSVPLLAELLRGPDSPPVLLVLSYRDEKLDGNPVLEQLCAPGAPTAPARPEHLVDVGPLSVEDSTRLARAAARLRGDATEEWARAIAQEAGGVPFFVEALALFAASEESAPSPAGATRVSIDRLIRHHAQALAPSARRLLEVFALAGRPTPLSLAGRVASIDRGEWHLAVELQSSRLLRSAGDPSHPVLECYHDRIREAIADGIPVEQRREYHGTMADALLSQADPAPEVLALHLTGAGRATEAAPFARMAAENALRGMAFARAAEYFRAALGSREWAPEERREMLEGLALALGSIGRGAEAAEHYIEAGDLAPEADRWRLRHKAAEQLLWGGYIARGKELLDSVLGEVGARLPRTAAGALFSLLRLRAVRTLRGLGYTSREEAEVPPRLRTLYDVYWSVTSGLGMVDAVLGALFQTRTLLTALRSGEPSRVASTLAAEAVFLAVFGGSGYAKADALLASCDSLVEQSGNIRTQAIVALSRAITRFQRGRWQECLDFSLEAHHLCVARCSGMPWETSTSAFYAAHSLGWLGRIREFREEFARLELDAKERGDLHTLHHLATAAVFPVSLLDDRPEQTRLALTEIMESLPAGKAHQLLSYTFRALALTALYEGNSEEAAHWADRLTRILRSPAVGKVVIIQLYACELRGNCAILAASVDPSRTDEARRTLRKEEARLRRFGLPWAETIAMALEGQRLALEGDVAGGAAALEAAATRYDEQGMRLHAVALRWRSTGISKGRPDGPEERLDALRTEGVENPARVLAMLAPPGRVNGRSGA